MLNRVLYYYKKEKKLLTYFLVSSFIVTALDLYGPIIVQDLIDLAIPSKDLDKFFTYSLVLLILYVFRFVISLYSSSRGQLMGNKIKFFMREDLFEKILKQPDSFFKERQSGDLISRVTNDLENVSSLLYRGLEDCLFSVLSIVGALVLMLKFNTKLTVITMIPLPFAIYFTIYKNKKLKVGYVDIRKNMSRVTSSVHDTLKTIFFIKDNSLEKEKFKRFSSDNEKLLEVEKKNVFNLSSLMSGINFYNQITQLIVIFLGGYLHIKGEISLGVIVSFILLTNRFRIYILRLIGLADIFQRGLSGIQRFSEIMEISKENDGSNILSDEITSIKISNLSHSYGDKNVLKDLSLEIKKGEKVAFVGESGVGKTTIFSLLKSSLLAQEKTIFINGKCIRTIKRESFLKRVGIVDQNEHLMNESVLENLKIIDRETGTEKLEEAMRLSYLKDVVDSLENKENTRLGEGGVSLSSGQKQRIAIARLFLKSPDIVLLDEGTSALDNILERKIMDNITNYFKDKIIISIAHRLNTLKNFDKIVVLGQEGVLEVGNFNELLEKKGLFFKMYSDNDKV
ncbi:ABC transporter ATP-binding protein [Cetobacterium sp. 8H]|uniref:ABC transporter ATP-binding protein n=1 Tax=Cetobacterium sp. 8H TaxID=2759681 RepID=UPI00163C736F|nr:ABC transporter ATP-binding protein [Cetobacterium sp. 8H]MBC2851548.1 ABC transporter ATP-binding protein [Cetobacterium sp. 8H]